MSFYASKHSPYISRHRNALTFRIRIPVDIQACLGRREYRRSLGRCYATEGKLRSLKLALAAHEVFTFAREALQARTPLGQSLTGITDTGKVRISLPPMCPHHPDRNRSKALWRKSIPLVSMDTQTALNYMGGP